MLHPYLSRPQDMPGRMKRNPHPVQMKWFAVGQPLEPGFRPPDPVLQHPQPRTRTQAGFRARPRMVTVRVGDQGALHRAGRIHMKSTRRTIQPSIRLNQHEPEKTRVSTLPSTPSPGQMRSLDLRNRCASGIRAAQVLRTDGQLWWAERVELAANRRGWASGLIPALEAAHAEAPGVHRPRVPGSGSRPGTLRAAERNVR